MILVNLRKERGKKRLKWTEIDENFHQQDDPLCHMAGYVAKMLSD
jgi:hypothetical protein